MSNRNWLETEDLKFTVQLLNFSEKIVPYASAFSLSPATLTAIQNDADFARFVILGNQQAQEYKKAWTELKLQIRYGTGGLVTSPFPAPVDLTVAPPIVDPGVEERFRAVVKNIKSNPNYTLGIGEILGIEADSSSIPDPNLAKPSFTVYMDSGHPVLKWVKGSFDGVEIWADYADGKNWVKLERDFKSPYADTHPLPALGVTAIWKYKMIYVKADSTIGLWSLDVPVSVYGAV